MKIEVPLISPQVVEQLVEREASNEVPAILMKIIADIDRERQMYKRLATDISKKWG